MGVGSCLNLFNVLFFKPVIYWDWSAGCMCVLLTSCCFHDLKSERICHQSGEEGQEGNTAGRDPKAMVTEDWMSFLRWGQRTNISHRHIHSFALSLSHSLYVSLTHSLTNFLCVSHPIQRSGIMSSYFQIRFQNAGAHLVDWIFCLLISLALVVMVWQANDRVVQRRLNGDTGSWLDLAVSRPSHTHLVEKKNTKNTWLFSETFVLFSNFGCGC